MKFLLPGDRRMTCFKSNALICTCTPKNKFKKGGVYIRRYLTPLPTPDQIEPVDRVLKSALVTTQMSRLVECSTFHT